MSASLRDYSRRSPYFLGSNRISTDRPRTESNGYLRPGERVLVQVPRGGDGEGLCTVSATAIDSVTIEDDDGIRRRIFRIIKRLL